MFPGQVAGLVGFLLCAVLLVCDFLRLLVLRRRLKPAPGLHRMVRWAMYAGLVVSLVGFFVSTAAIP